ncbi:MAG: nicotinate-nucleotide adenylyltransferase [Lentihominibacter sp.]
MKKIGVFGGSFDPVHYGHLGLASDSVSEAGLCEVVMVPARIQPFKQNKKITSGEDRFRMLALVAATDDRITASRYELDREGVSYTYLTLRYLQKFYDDISASHNDEPVRLYFICGTDSFLKIENWMEAEEMLTRYSFIVGNRPGYRHDELADCMSHLKERYGTEVIRINNRQLDISSTLIRDRLAAGEGIDDLVPEAVERYIRDNGLYRI